MLRGEFTVKDLNPGYISAQHVGIVTLAKTVGRRHQRFWDLEIPQGDTGFEWKQTKCCTYTGEDPCAICALGTLAFLAILVEACYTYLSLVTATIDI